MMRNYSLYKTEVIYCDFIYNACMIKLSENNKSDNISKKQIYNLYIAKNVIQANRGKKKPLVCGLNMKSGILLYAAHLLGCEIYGQFDAKYKESMILSPIVLHKLNKLGMIRSNTDLVVYDNLNSPNSMNYAIYQRMERKLRQGDLALLTGTALPIIRSYKFSQFHLRKNLDLVVKK